MRSVLVVILLVILGLLALGFYRDIETRAMAEQAVERADKAEVELGKLRASLRVLSANVEGRILPARKTRVMVYFHPAGLTDKDATKLAASLKPYGFDVQVARHPAAKRPDAVFIGAAVSAEEAQLVLSSVPYDVDYVFRVDYPRQFGGDPDGRSIGIGYLSTHGKADDVRTKPVKITRQQLASLLQPKISNTEFQLRLRHIAGP